ncbi:hypothetical protein CORC01_00006 [Colletotrichum orchidophilum]|uniref:PD-(D/E)XK nuclease-like domain-containing protein n=1 Tax=Colletotrichum orchidophilum TaxID=1209926 RepID=A0A1G4BT66_9PEZI|nr:uncharacterized protein CORC01_00006 [Colletotrichum orchidophilum]OHF04535.1 hypothetical protein CORC01_00006 [Colletotrichum orchidophilum]
MPTTATGTAIATATEPRTTGLSKAETTFTFTIPNTQLYSSIKPLDSTSIQLPEAPTKSHEVVLVDHLYADCHETYLSSLSEPREMVSSPSTTTPRKRRATQLVDTDNAPDEFVRGSDHDETPRPAQPTRVSSYRNSPMSSPTKSSSASHRSESVSGRSTSSARHKFVKLPLGTEGIIKRQFSGPPTNPEHPVAIQDMLSRIRSLEQNARRCFEMDHDEPVWNVEVHNLLLTKVFRGRDRDTRQSSTNLCDFSLCTTASIIKNYVPIDMSDKRIDFCIYLNPSADMTTANIKGKVLALRNRLPRLSLNHTSYGALCPYPISVGLETKRPGHDLDGAVLQIGVWQAAHWTMLRRLLRRAAPELLREHGILSPTVDDVERSIQQALFELGALHGVAIQGHDWIYVATSPEPPEPMQPQDSANQPERLASSRTILWLGKRFGDTNSALGIHQVAAFLEYLALWSSQTYWPWFKKWIVASE